MRTILISTSKFGSSVTDYYKGLGDVFINHGYRVVYIFDQLYKDYPLTENPNIIYYTWLNKRPTKFNDFIFFYKILKKEKPILCLSNFGSTNVVSVLSFISNIKVRINYIHTTSVQLKIDSKKGSLKDFFLKYRKKSIYKMCTHLFTNSLGTKNDTIKFYDIEENKISVFPLLINGSELDYIPYENRENTLCLVGRLHPSKGHEEFLYLFQNCLKKHPKLKLKIVGEGYLKDKLITLTKTLGISDNVMFTGNIAKDCVNEVFSSSLISISCSIDEAFGLVNIEALREGTPIVCTKTAGTIDILEEGANGEFFTLKDENSLCIALDKILVDWNSYSNNSSRSFNNKYNLNIIANHFNKIERLL
jgi:glycosyltransferase involved in cell wall biosynthesis